MGHTLEQLAATMHDILAADPGPAGREKVRALVQEVLTDEASAIAAQQDLRAIGYQAQLADARPLAAGPAPRFLPR